MPAPPALSRHRGALDEYLRSLLTRRDPPELYRMVRYHLGWEDAQGRATGDGGKAVRPALCLLACEGAGGDWRNALPAAAALELVHNFSLVHDDIQDRDEERRHRPTVWSVWGEAQAINAGDALLALARLAVLGLIEGDVRPATVMEAARILDERTLEVVEGQVMDLEFEQHLDVGVEDYLTMIGKKTGALFSASLALGALAGGAEPTTIEAAGRFGRLLGIGFQVRDDIMGVWGAESETGKRPASDIRRRKKSLPVVYALNRATGEALQDLRRVYARRDPDEDGVRLVLRHLETLGAREYCLERLDTYRRETLSALDGIPFTTGPAADLREVAEYLLIYE